MKLVIDNVYDAFNYFEKVQIFSQFHAQINHLVKQFLVKVLYQMNEHRTYYLNYSFLSFFVYMLMKWIYKEF